MTSILVILFATIGLILVGICSFVLYKHQETPLVKAANSELSSLLMVTTALSFVSILSLAKPIDVTCSLVHCWRSTVLVTFILILILKTMKILSAFQISVIAESFKKFILSAKSQAFLVLALNFVPGMFLSFWIALDAPTQEGSYGQYKEPFYCRVLCINRLLECHCRSPFLYIHRSLQLFARFMPSKQEHCPKILTKLDILDFLCTFYCFRR